MEIKKDNIFSIDSVNREKVIKKKPNDKGSLSQISETREKRRIAGNQQIEEAELKVDLNIIKSFLELPEDASEEEVYNCILERLKKIRASRLKLVK